MKEKEKGLSGQNDPKQQYIIRDIMNDMHRKNIDAVPEEKVHFGESSKYAIPDIVIRKDNCIVYVEICKSKAVLNDTAKLKKLMQQNNIASEGFVYDYIKEVWYTVHKEVGKRRTLGSHSTILDYDLSRSLRLAKSKSKAKEILEYTGKSNPKQK